MDILTPVSQANGLVKSCETQFNQVVSENNLDVKFKREALFASQKFGMNPKRPNDPNYFTSVALRYPQTIKNAVLNIATIDLSLNPAEKLAYLIPRYDGIHLNVSYLGLVKLATDTDSINFVVSKMVYEKDTFEYNGVSIEPTHKINPFGDRGKLVGVYCFAETSTGKYLTETMTIEEVNSIRDRCSDSYKKKQGPWVTDYEEMAKKTVVKRASKLWPKTDKSQRLDQAIHIINAHEGIDFQAQEKKALEEKKEIAKSLVEDRRKAYEIIEQIKNVSSEITKGDGRDEKLMFLEDVLKVENFDDLRKKNVSQLEETLKEVNEILKSKKELE